MVKVYIYPIYIVKGVRGIKSGKSIRVNISKKMFERIKGSDEKRRKFIKLVLKKINKEDKFYKPTYWGISSWRYTATGQARIFSLKPVKTHPM